MLDVDLKWFEAKKKLQDYIKINNIPLDKIALSFSGGKDSMVMLELIKEIGFMNDIKIVFSNTNMEYDATITFINDLKNDGIPIIEINEAVPQPIIYKEHGYPVHSKMTSYHLSELQRINFNFKNDTYANWEKNYKKYGRGKAQFRWLDGDFCRSCPKYLKARLKDIDFKVSNKCCLYSKKIPLTKFNKQNKILLSIIGVRKAEGGARSLFIKNCLNTNKDVIEFYPLFHFSNEDITYIIKSKKIKLSECYTKYGMERTGCFCCPYSKDWKHNLEILKKHEPTKYVAALNMFDKVFKIQDRDKW